MCTVHWLCLRGEVVVLKALCVSAGQLDPLLKVGPHLSVLVFVAQSRARRNAGFSVLAYSNPVAMYCFSLLPFPSLLVAILHSICIQLGGGVLVGGCGTGETQDVLYPTPQ